MRITSREARPRKGKEDAGDLATAVYEDIAAEAVPRPVALGRIPRRGRARAWRRIECRRPSGEELLMLAGCHEDLQALFYNG